MNYLITVDIGTTAVKACLWDQKLSRVASVNREYALLTPSPGIVELDPDTYWDAVRDGVREIVKASGVSPFDIGALVPTTQAETLIPVDRDHRPVHNAIVWLDARAEREAREAAEVLYDHGFYAHTGIPAVGPAVPLCKELWLKRHKPDVFARTKSFLMLEDYIIMRLTDALVTEPSVACSSGCYDIVTGEPWEPALALLERDASVLPRALPSGTIVERLTSHAAAALGLTTSTHVVTGAFDQACSALGAGNTRCGTVTETTGTALVLTAVSPDRDIVRYTPVPIYRHWDHSLLLTPYASSAGIVLKWFRDNFCHHLRDQANSYDSLGALAASVPPGSDGLLLLPHFEGAVTPEYNPEATGTFHGVTLAHGPGHFVRAIMEGIAFALRDNIGVLERTAVPVERVLCLGGGAKSRLWCRIKADVCGVPMATVAEQETTSLGAAILGAVALDWHTTVDAACSHAVRPADIHEPSQERREVYDQAYNRYLETYRRLWSGGSADGTVEKG
ncbi:MAG: hypothetical protein GF331_18110 [Chitinivibrionales bacterium]|nr:hypothetical protein [Chitinivibrionales bacterium]